MTDPAAPTEPEIAEGLVSPFCEACKQRIDGRYRVLGPGRYHFDNGAEHEACRRAWYEGSNLPREGLDLEASALGIPVAEIIANTLPSNEKVLAKIAGRKDDSGKLRYTLLPWDAVTE